MYIFLIQINLSISNGAYIKCDFIFNKIFYIYWVFKATLIHIIKQHYTHNTFSFLFDIVFIIIYTIHVFTGQHKNIDRRNTLFLYHIVLIIVYTFSYIYLYYTSLLYLEIFFKKMICFYTSIVNTLWSLWTLVYVPLPFRLYNSYRNPHIIL